MQPENEKSKKGRLVACDSDLCNAGPVDVCSTTTSAISTNFWNILMSEEILEWLLLMYVMVAAFVMVHY